MTDITTDPNDPRLGHGTDAERVPQNAVYLVLSNEERAKGFVRPVRSAYIHVGPPKPRFKTRPLTAEEQERNGGEYVLYEEYPESEAPVLGRYWTSRDLARKGCGAITTMGQAIAETYARDPKFYGSTYCCACSRHLPVGQYGEFIWEDGSRVGT